MLIGKKFATSFSASSFVTLILSLWTAPLVTFIHAQPQTAAVLSSGDDLLLVSRPGGSVYANTIDVPFSITNLYNKLVALETRVTKLEDENAGLKLELVQ